MSIIFGVFFKPCSNGLFHCFGGTCCLHCHSAGMWFVCTLTPVMAIIG